MTLSITVLGVVQGVGYRPFVARMAEGLGVRGTVRNNNGIVEITAEAEKQAMDEFIHRLKAYQPNGADVAQILTVPAEQKSFDRFRIIQSVQDSGETPLIPPDLPICEDCLKELSSPGDRRYRYPFISCVACGPRYSILDRLPYDRCNITMDCFPMCEACKEEYTTNTRRRHAQTISCHDCGPQLIFETGGRIDHGEEALILGIAKLRSGAVLALKGIGGYQFACLPTDETAVNRLRLLKHREKKPFAVMFPSVESVKKICVVSQQEEELLTSAARPIVLLEKTKEEFCRSVSGESRFLGAFLPYTGLHQMLTEECGPLVMTSGNFTNQPIFTDDAQMLGFQSEYLDGVLYQERKIVTPLDDSVARVVCGAPQLIRRSRGYVPAPVFLEQRVEKPILAMGGDLKACFCLLSGNRAYLSQYFGDMEQYEIMQVYRRNLARMEQLFGITPQIAVCDLHPGYLTSHYAKELGLSVLEVQHHHAHIVSVMAEHSLKSCIGVAFDGTGYGTDGCVWGGEFLLCSGSRYERAAHLGYVTLCGGDRSAKDAELTANCFLYAAGIERPGSNFALIRAALVNRINTCESASMGRLFDAVSAILNIRKINSYEGECAIALENAAAAAQSAGEAPYPLDFQIQNTENGLILGQLGLIRAVYAAAASGVSCQSLALGFHHALSRAVLAVCRNIREESGETTVALSGGVFSNLLLTQLCDKLLKDDGFSVFLNRSVPCSDSGICLGQAWLGAHYEQSSL